MCQDSVQLYRLYLAVDDSWPHCARRAALCANVSLVFRARGTVFDALRS